MLDQLINAAKGQLGDVISNQGVTTDKLDYIAGISKDTLKEGVMDQVSSGNLDGIMNLFTGKEEATSGNPIVSSMISMFTQKATSSLGLDDSKAGGIAAAVIPMVVQLVQSKFSGDDGADNGDLLSSLGLSGDGLMDKAKDLLGDKAKDLLGGKGLGNLFS